MDLLVKARYPRTAYNGSRKIAQRAASGDRAAEAQLVTEPWLRSRLLLLSGVQAAEGYPEKEAEPVPAEENKVSVYTPKIKPSSSELAVLGGAANDAEDETMALAIRIACEDPTERDHLSRTVLIARSRLRAAAAELVRAFVALFFAWLARLILDRSRKKITALRGEIGRAECGVLALQRLLGGFWVRKLLGRRTLVRMLGARGDTDDEGGTVYSLKLAGRRYREGDGFGADHHGSAADAPMITVMLGVKITATGEPAWCLKRFVRTESGRFREIHRVYEPDAQSLLVAFYTEPSPTAASAELAEVAEELSQEASQGEENIGKAA